MATDPVRDIERSVQAAVRRNVYTRPGHGARQAGNAALALLALSAAGVGVAYAARPVTEAVAGVIIEGERQLREHCMRSAPHVGR